MTGVQTCALPIFAWSTTEAFPDGLLARDYRVREAEVTIRYEMHYPGWAPGCDGQTEGEDVYRFVGERDTLVRRSEERRVGKECTSW